MVRAPSAFLLGFPLSFRQKRASSCGIRIPCALPAGPSAMTGFGVPLVALHLPLEKAKNRKALMLGIALVAGLGGAALVAQIEGDRGIPPIASNGDYEVRGIEVNVGGDNAEDARNKGWREAQRMAWTKLWESNGSGGAAPGLDDSTIESMVSAVGVEHEQIGPRRPPA